MTARRRHSKAGAALLLAGLLQLIAAPAAAHEITAPKPILRPPAEWPVPPSAHDVVVLVILTVGRDGAVEHVKVAVSVDPKLDAAAIRAARRWVFEPARDAQGKPVAAKVRAVVRFEGETPEPPKPQPDPAGEPSPAPPPSPTPAPAEVQVVGHGPEEHPIEVRVRGQRRVSTASAASRSRRLLDAAPRGTGSDLLLTMPGVFITQHSGEGKAHQIFYRGFDAVHGQDLEVTVAGVPVNEVSHIHGQGYADMHFVIPEVVRRIDALPGSFEPEQGDFALAGSMRFHLGLREPGITASGAYGMFNTRRVFLAYHPEGEPEETFAAFEAYGTDGFGVGRAAQRTSGMGQLLISISPRTQLRLMGSAYAGRFGSAGVLVSDDVRAGRIDRFGSYDTDQGGHSTRAQLVSELTHGGEGWRLSVMPWVVRRSLEFSFNYAGDVPGVGSGNTRQINGVTTLGLTSRFEKALHLLSDHDSVSAGLFLRHDIISQEQRANDGQRPPDADAAISATDAAGWLRLSLKPLSRVRVRAGVRVDGLSYRVDDRLIDQTRSAQGLQIGPKATVDVGIVPGLNALASYGMGFRSPQARSLADGEDAPFTRSHGFELGLRYRRGSLLKASAAGFATLLSDDLVFNEAANRNEAVPATMRLGATADVTLTPSDWLITAFSATYTRASFREGNARFAEGDLLPYVPQLVMRGDTAVTPELTHFWNRTLRGRISFGYSYLYNRLLPFGERGSDVFLVNAKAGLRLKEVELSVDATNLLGIDWNDSELVYSSALGSGPTQAIPRRHFTAGAPRRIVGTLTLRL